MSLDIPSTFPPEYLEYSMTAPVCCQISLPENNGGLAEKKFCWALKFWELKQAISGFEHAVRNGALDTRHIDFIAWFYCKAGLRFQVKSSEEGAKKFNKQVNKGDISSKIELMVVPPKMTILEVVKVLNSHFSYHLNGCSDCHNLISAPLV